MNIKALCIQSIILISLPLQASFFVEFVVEDPYFVHSHNLVNEIDERLYDISEIDVKNFIIQVPSSYYQPLSWDKNLNFRTSDILPLCQTSLRFL